MLAIELPGNFLCSCIQCICSIVDMQGLIGGGGGGGGLDGVAGHPPFICSFVRNIIGVGLSLLNSHPHSHPLNQAFDNGSRSLQGIQLSLG